MRSMEKKITIDCISDLHGYFPKLDGGDLLIVAGDLTATHTLREYNEFMRWFEKQEYRKKVYILGNHDTFYHPDFDDKPWCSFLHDSGTEFEGLKIWGTPWSLWFPEINPKCKAFTGSEEELEKRYRNIPYDIDILISHSPPFGILDKIYIHGNEPFADSAYVGSKSLRNILFGSDIKLHVFGHIHEHGGKMVDLVMTKCVNASIMNEHYKPVNKPVRIELDV